MPPSIGIDLGTTNCAVATVVKGEPHLIERATGQRLLPSLVGIREDGTRVVGEEARLLMETTPEAVAHATKRFIGQRWTPELAARARLLYPYQLVAGPHDDVRVKLAGQALPISQISAMLLSELRLDAEEFFDREVTRAVVTVPANFTDAQRAATREAAEIAGLKVLRLVNEPTAAAMAFGLAHGFSGNAVVFDLGGGTFDVSVLRIDKGVFEVLATAGDPYFGGDDFDNVLVQWLLGHITDEPSRERLTRDRAAVQQLKLVAERAKCEVSQATFARISTVLMPDSKQGGIPLESMLTRAFFENLVRPKTEYALKIVEQALNEANLDQSQVDSVLLVGGMTRVPLLRQLVAAHFHKEPDVRVDPDEAVALGAAIHAAELVEKGGKTLLLDVVGSTLGVQVAGGLVKPLISRNTMLPCSSTEIFYPGRDGQTVVRVPVVQGESSRAAENVRLGELALEDLAETLRREHELHVTFSLDTEGQLAISVTDQHSGQVKAVTIDQRTNLGGDETTALAQRETAHRKAQQSTDPAERRATRHARRALHGVLVSLRRLQQELFHVAKEADQTEAKAVAVTLAEAIKAGDEVERTGSREEIEQVTARLVIALQRLSS